MHRPARAHSMSPAAYLGMRTERNTLTAVKPNSAAALRISRSGRRRTACTETDMKEEAGPGTRPRLKSIITVILVMH